MKTLFLSFAMVVAIGGCSQQPERVRSANASLPLGLDSYFERYCDYTGGLGIGFVPSHTYDYQFRQHLKATHDPELKRLFVLQHLHRDVEFALNDFKAGIRRTGKSSSQPLTFSEWQSTQERIRSQIDDLAIYVAFTNFASVQHDPFTRIDPNLDESWIDELRGTLRSVTNAPANGELLKQTAAEP
jgi:hypothetical protein